MIRKALGLGLMILILKFLMKEVFNAGENTMIQMLDTASAVLSKVGSGASTPDPTGLIPH